MRSGTILGLGLLWAGAAVAAPTLDQIQACMRANVPKTLQVRQIEVAATDRSGGSRVLRGRLFANTEDDRLRAMMKIMEPSDLAGAAYLLREARDEKANDEMYVYVPALSKVRRITGAAIDGSLWGTDLSYADVKQMQNAFSGAEGKVEGQAELEKRTTNVLAFTPPLSQETRFTTIRAWVDDKTCVPLKMEFLEGTAVSKRMTVKAADLKQSGKHWYASEAVMTDLRQNTSTRVKTVDVEADGKLADRYFNPATFYIGN